jgi:hypothetical protein
MQYVEKNVYTNDPLKARGLYKKFWCSQIGNALPTHISNMDTGAIFASRGFLLGNNSPPRTHDLFCEVGRSPAAPNYLPSSNYKKNPNIFNSSAIFEKDCLRPLSKKTLLGNKFLSRDLISSLGEWTLYSYKLATSSLKLSRHHTPLLLKEWFGKSKPLSAWSPPYSNFYQTLLSRSKVADYSRPTGYLAPIPSG